jgi:hypothetical protein
LVVVLLLPLLLLLALLLALLLLALPLLLALLLHRRRLLLPSCRWEGRRRKQRPQLHRLHRHRLRGRPALPCCRA